ncbi:hypothetical protein PR003_g19927 [Phytophthora rubi]|uniref:Uncharacterized protein n=1 Tax=Phytophthora rubi TaxID=129364 RepID=A0A6A4DTD0_9STRA|nr:hypothetical protein PR003_g19927 [Phytophthora rubi]
MREVAVYLQHGPVKIASDASRSALKPSTVSALAEERHARGQKVDLEVTHG